MSPLCPHSEWSPQLVTITAPNTHSVWRLPTTRAFSEHIQKIQKTGLNVYERPGLVYIIITNVIVTLLCIVPIVLSLSPSERYSYSLFTPCILRFFCVSCVTTMTAGGLQPVTACIASTQGFPLPEHFL